MKHLCNTGHILPKILEIMTQITQYFSLLTVSK